MKHITKSQLNEATLILPDENLQNAFNAKAEQIYKTKKNYKKGVFRQFIYKQELSKRFNLFP